MKNQVKTEKIAKVLMDKIHRPLIAAPVAGSGRNDVLKKVAVKLESVRRVIARYAILEKNLSKSLTEMTSVGQMIITNKKGMPFIKVNHLHFEETEVKAHLRSAYDKVLVERL